MENRHRMWHRFVTRLRSTRKTHSFITRSVTEERNISDSSVAVDIFFPGRYSRFGKSHPTSRPRLQISSHNEWNFATSFARLGRLDKLVSFTPKCLTGINVQTLLCGQTSYDDFSHSCWLENHLHRFGGIQIDTVRNENSRSVTDNGSDADVISLEIVSAASNSGHEVLVPSTADIWHSTTATDINTTSNNIHSYVSSTTTVSDITHFYQAGFPFDPDSIFTDPPPPYSEIHNDPPPPYTHIQDTEMNRSEGSVTRNASNQGLHCHDILW